MCYQRAVKGKMENWEGAKQTELTQASKDILLSPALSCFISEIGSLTGPEAHWLTRLTAQGVLRICLSLAEAIGTHCHIWLPTWATRIRSRFPCLSGKHLTHRTITQPSLLPPALVLQLTVFMNEQDSRSGLLYQLPPSTAKHSEGPEVLWSPG